MHIQNQNRVNPIQIVETPGKAERFDLILDAIECILIAISKKKYPSIGIRKKAIQKRKNAVRKSIKKTRKTSPF